MLPTLPTQIAAAAKSQWASQLELWTTLNSMALESVTKLVDLNLNIAKQSLVNSSAAAQQLLHAGVDSASSGSNQNPLQPDVGNVLSYARQAADIALGMQAEIAKLAQESVEETGRKMREMVQDAEKSAPAGDGNPVDLMRSAINQMNDGYAQWSQAFSNGAGAMHATAAPGAGARAKK